MAKLARLMNKIRDLEMKLELCSKAYLDVVEKYKELYTKYSYEETMEQVKKVEEKRRKEGKIIL